MLILSALWDRKPWHWLNTMTITPSTTLAHTGQTCLRGLIRTKEPVSLLSQEGRRKGLCFRFIWIIRIYIIKLLRVWETKRKQRSYLDFEVSAIGSEKLSFFFFSISILRIEMRFFSPLLRLVPLQPNRTHGVSITWRQNPITKSGNCPSATDRTL